MPKNKGAYLLILLLSLGIIKIFSKCNDDTDCSSRYNCIDEICEHESLFDNFKFFDLLGVIIIFLLSIGACMAGIGGGAFNMPIGLLLFKMDAHEAVPFSVAVVTGVMVFRVLTQLIKNQRHSFKNQSIINYDIACLFAPSIFLGAQIGVILNRILLSWMILLFYIFAMACNIYVTKQKYHKQVLKEKKKLVEQLIEKNEENEMQELKQLEDNKIKSEVALTSEEIKVKQRIEEIKQLNARNVKWDRIQFIALSMATMLIIDLLKGSSTIPSILSITPCSWQWWAMSVVYTPFGLYYVLLIYQRYLKESQEKIELKMEIDENEFKYDKDLIIRISLLGILTGIVAAILGIGGGIVTAPVLLSLGLEPSETSATTSFIILFTCLMNLIKYMMIGSILWDYAIFATFAGCIGFYIGLKCISLAVKYNKQSLIIMALLLVSLAASALVIFVGVKNAREDYLNGINIFMFHSVCSK